MKTQHKKVMVALDVPTLVEAKKLVRKLSGVIHYFKVGSELFTASGPGVIRYIHACKGEVFLDLKFHDIPNTVARAVKVASASGVFMINVHASGGAAMMRAARDVFKGMKKRPLLIAVTVLTSMQDEDLVQIGLKEGSKEQVLHLARLAKSCGLDGVVCSPQEAKIIRKTLGKSFVLVTPGVRPQGTALGDQKRVTTPKEAFRNGAHFIVVGRPITHAKDPLKAAQEILKGL